MGKVIKFKRRKKVTFTQKEWDELCVQVLAQTEYVQKAKGNERLKYIREEYDEAADEPGRGRRKKGAWFQYHGGASGGLTGRYGGGMTWLTIKGRVVAFVFEHDGIEYAFTENADIDSALRGKILGWGAKRGSYKNRHLNLYPNVSEGRAAPQLFPYYVRRLKPVNEKESAWQEPEPFTAEDMDDYLDALSRDFFGDELLELPGRDDDKVLYAMVEASANAFREKGVGLIGEPGGNPLAMLMESVMAKSQTGTE